MTYLVLSLLTILSFYWFSKKVQYKDSNHYYLYAIIPTFFYCITYGFRTGWAVDYVVYDSLFRGVSKLGIDSYEPLFAFVVNTLSSINNSTSIHFFVFTAIVTMMSFIILIKRSKEISFYALSLYYLFTAYQAANLVRYFMAISLIYISFELAFTKKYGLMILTLMASFFIHYSAGILIVIAFILYKYKLFLNLKINIILFTFVSFLNVHSIQQALAKPLTAFIMMLNLGDNQLSKYADTENVSTVLLGNRAGTVEISFIYSFCTIAFAYLFIYYGHKVMKLVCTNEISYYYNLGVLGLILSQISFGAEVFSRISFFFFYISVIIISYIFYYRKILFGNMFTFLLLVVVTSYICYTSINGLFKSFNVLYVWD